MATVPLIIKIKDYVYFKSITVPTTAQPISTTQPAQPSLDQHLVTMDVQFDPRGCGSGTTNYFKSYRAGAQVNQGSFQISCSYSSPGQILDKLMNLSGVTQSDIFYVNGILKFTGTLYKPPEPTPVPVISEPTPVLIPTPTITQPPQEQLVSTGETRIVRILPEGESRLPNANTGETVKITATVICKSGTTISRPRDTAYLIVDGAIADRKSIENGIVTFEWEATSVPTNIHTMCVKVDPSSGCRSPGQDCKKISVSSSTLSIEDQLARERASSLEQKKLLEQARSTLREQIIGAELVIPGAEGYTSYIPSTISPIITSPPPTTIVEPTPTAPTPEYGDIQIVGIPATLLPITPDLPLYVYIDDKNIGRLYELPKTTTVLVGSHSVYIRAGDITTPSKTVFVKKNETTTVTL